MALATAIAITEKEEEEGVQKEEELQRSKVNGGWGVQGGGVSWQLAKLLFHN